MATLVWSDRRWKAVHKRSSTSHKGKDGRPWLSRVAGFFSTMLPASDEHNDLAWLSLSRNGEVHTVDGDICHLTLMCEGDPDTESPDPFLSDADWRKLVAGHEGP